MSQSTPPTSGRRARPVRPDPRAEPQGEAPPAPRAEVATRPASIEVPAATISSPPPPGGPRRTPAHTLTGMPIPSAREAAITTRERAPAPAPAQPEPQPPATPSTSQRSAVRPSRELAAARAESTVEALLRPLDALRSQLAELHAGLEAERARGKLLEDGTIELREHLERAVDERDAAVGELKASALRFEEQKQELTRELDEQRTWAMKLRSNDQKSTAELAASREHGVALETALEKERAAGQESVAQLEKLASDHAVTVRALQEAEVTARTLRLGNERLSKDNDGLRRGVDMSRAQLAQMQKRLESVGATAESVLELVGSVQKLEADAAQQRKGAEELLKRLVRHAEELGKVSALDKTKTTPSMNAVKPVGSAAAMAAQARTASAPRMPGTSTAPSAELELSPVEELAEIEDLDPEG